jgi:hypothetical protein
MRGTANWTEPDACRFSQSSMRPWVATGSMGLLRRPWRRRWGWRGGRGAGGGCGLAALITLPGAGGCTAAGWDAGRGVQGATGTATRGANDMTDTVHENFECRSQPLLRLRYLKLQPRLWDNAV